MHRISCRLGRTQPRQVAVAAYAENVSGSLDNIIAEAIQLPPDQRLTVAHRLLRSVEPEPGDEIEAVWEAEIRKRIARYDTGAVRSIPATEVFLELDRRLEK
jgi:putative addiction module component (TIGR02574 family)